MEGKVAIFDQLTAQRQTPAMVEVTARHFAWSYAARLELGTHFHSHQNTGLCRLCRIYEAWGMDLPTDRVMQAPYADLASYDGWLRTTLYFLN